LKGVGAAGFAGGVASLTGLGASQAWAASASGYKAMVCIYLYGGLDGTDTILPFDIASHNQLKSIRRDLLNPTRTSRNVENLLKLNPENSGVFGGREFAMPQDLAPLHAMFERGELAILGNVGSLVEPVNRTQMINGSAILPPRLGSHNDHTALWQSMGVEGVNRGWGGLFMDRVLSAAPEHSRVFGTIATQDMDVFLAGAQAAPFRIGINGVDQADIYSERGTLG